MSSTTSPPTPSSSLSATPTPTTSPISRSIASSTTSNNNNNNLNASYLFDPSNIAGTGPYFDSSGTDAATQVLVGLILGSVCILVFSWLRPKFPDLYSPRIRLRRRRPLNLPKSYFGWMWTVIKTPDEFVLQTLGLDSLIYLRFWRMCIYIFIILNLWALVLVVPINHLWSELREDTTEGNGSVDNDKESRKPFDSPLKAVPRGSPYGIAHVFAVYIFSAIVIYCLDRFSLHVISLRWHFLLYTRHSVPARTVMISHLPHPLRDRRALRRFLYRMRLGPIERIYICPSGNKILSYLNARTNALRWLERYYYARVRNLTSNPDYSPRKLAKIAVLPGKEHRDEAHQLLLQWGGSSNPPPSPESLTSPANGTTCSPGRGKMPPMPPTLDLKRIEEAGRRSLSIATSTNSDTITDQYFRPISSPVLSSNSQHQQQQRQRQMSPKDTIPSPNNSNSSSSSAPRPLSNATVTYPPGNSSSRCRHRISHVRRLSRYYLFGWYHRRAAARRERLLEKQLQRFMESDITIQRYRLNPEKRGPSHVAFVTMKRSVDAHIAASIQIHSQPNMMHVALAEEPRAIVWKNIWRSSSVRWIRQTTELILTFLLMVLWVVPVILISTLISLKFLIHVFPSLEDFAETHHVARSLLGYTLPSLILTIFLTILPKILRGFVVFGSARTLVSVDIQVLHRHFVFLVIYVILIFSMSGTVFSTIADLFEAPGNIAQRLITSVPNVASWFTVYTMLYGAGYQVLKLLQLKGVCRWIWHRWWAKTPRDFSDLMAPIYVDWGALYPWPMLFYWICMTYSCISPLILFMGLIYFLVGLFIQKYLLLYSWHNRYESAGRHWPSVLVWLVIGVIFFQLIMLGFFTIGNSKYYSPPLVFPPVFTLLYLIYRIPSLRKLMYTVPIQLLREVEYRRCQLVRQAKVVVPSNTPALPTLASQFSFSSARRPPMNSVPTTQAVGDCGDKYRSHHRSMSTSLPTTTTTTFSLKPAPVYRAMSMAAAATSSATPSLSSSSAGNAQRYSAACQPVTATTMTASLENGGELGHVSTAPLSMRQRSPSHLYYSRNTRRGHSCMSVTRTSSGAIPTRSLFHRGIKARRHQRHRSSHNYHPILSHIPQSKGSASTPSAVDGAAESCGDCYGPGGCPEAKNLADNEETKQHIMAANVVGTGGGDDSSSSSSNNNNNDCPQQSDEKKPRQQAPARNSMEYYTRLISFDIRNLPKQTVLFRKIAHVLSQILLFLHGDPAADLIPYFDSYAFPQGHITAEWYEQMKSACPAAYSNNNPQDTGCTPDPEKKPTIWQQFGPFIKYPIRWIRSPRVYFWKLIHVMSWGNISPIVKRFLRELTMNYSIPTLDIPGNAAKSLSEMPANNSQLPQPDLPTEDRSYGSDNSKALAEGEACTIVIKETSPYSEGEAVLGEKENIDRIPADQQPLVTADGASNSSSCRDYQMGTAKPSGRITTAIHESEGTPTPTPPHSQNIRCRLPSVIISGPPSSPLASSSIAAGSATTPPNAERRGLVTATSAYLPIVHQQQHLHRRRNHRRDNRDGEGEDGSSGDNNSVSDGGSSSSSSSTEEYSSDEFTDTSLSGSDSDDMVARRHRDEETKAHSNKCRRRAAHRFWHRVMDDFPLKSNGRSIYTFQARSDELPADFEMGKNRTNFSQCPMTFMKGVLDSTGRQYISPAYVGALPQLWLPAPKAKKQKRRRRQIRHYHHSHRRNVVGGNNAPTLGTSSGHNCGGMPPEVLL